MTEAAIMLLLIEEMNDFRNYLEHVAPSWIGAKARHGIMDHIDNLEHIITNGENR